MKQILSLLFSVFIMTTTSVSANQAYDDVSIKTISVTDNIYMLEGMGGNIGAIKGADGLLIIDDQFLELSDKIKQALNNLDSGEVQFVLNTHWHYDHTGGNRAFANDATIISHKNVRKLLSTDQVIEFFNKTVEATPKEALPVITFDEEISIHFNNATIHVIHAPDAHTNGDSYVHFEEQNVIHAGDLFFNGIYPFIDVDHGGSIDGMIQAVDILIDLADDQTKIIPGHGPLASKADLESFSFMLIASREYVEAQISKGLSLEDMQNSGMPKEFESWNDGFLKEDKWIQIVYDSLLK